MLNVKNVVSCFQTKHKLNFGFALFIPSRRLRTTYSDVLAHCSRMVVGHLTPDGMLACILSEAPADLEIAYLSTPPEDDL